MISTSLLKPINYTDRSPINSNDLNIKLNNINPTPNPFCFNNVSSRYLLNNKVKKKDFFIKNTSVNTPVNAPVNAPVAAVSVPIIVHLNVVPVTTVLVPAVVPTVVPAIVPVIKPAMKLINNRYLLKSKIGKGSFSKVYKALDNITNTYVAVKKIECVDLSSDMKRRLDYEIDIYKKLDHPNIIKLYDVIRNETKHRIYIILEYCENGTLHELITKKQLTELQILDYFTQLRNAFKYMTICRIMHRDLKPQNLLICNDYKTIKLGDFGFAKEIGSENDMVETLCGSPLFMAPEIIMREKYTMKADLWSLGLILYKLIYGFHPFEDCKNLYELVTKIKNRPIIFAPYRPISESANRIANTKIINNDCLCLLKKLLQINYAQRINWDDFLTHKWFNVNVNTNTDIKQIPESVIIQNAPTKPDMCLLDNLSEIDDFGQFQNVTGELTTDEAAILAEKSLQELPDSFQNQPIPVKITDKGQVRNSPIESVADSFRNRPVSCAIPIKQSNNYNINDINEFNDMNDMNDSYEKYNEQKLKIDDSHVILFTPKENEHSIIENYMRLPSPCSFEDTSIIKINVLNTTSGHRPIPESAYINPPIKTNRNNINNINNINNRNNQHNQKDNGVANIVVLMTNSIDKMYRRAGRYFSY
jgi:serine/threonine protein kinase